MIDDFKEICSVAPATHFKYDNIKRTQKIQAHTRYKYNFIHKHAKEKSKLSIIPKRAPCAQMMFPGQEF